MYLSDIFIYTVLHIYVDIYEIGRRQKGIWDEENLAKRKLNNNEIVTKEKKIQPEKKIGELYQLKTSEKTL